MAAARGELYIVSDLHLHDDEQPFMFTPSKEEIFIRLCQNVIEDDACLLLAGDIFDLTGTEAPHNAHRDFFIEVLGENSLKSAIIQEALTVRPLAEQFRSIQIRFPRFFAVLSQLARLKKLKIIPGNHDYALGQPEGQKIFSQLLGVTSSDLEFREFFDSGSYLIAGHGHEFDPANCSRGDKPNPGRVITSVLFNALMPALLEMGINARLVAAIPAVRPEEAIVEALDHYLGAQTPAFLLAFVRLLQRNHYFTGRSAVLMSVVTGHIPFVSKYLQKNINVERVRAAMPDDCSLIRNSQRGAQLLREKYSAQMVILGHTHQLDLQPHSINLGTWIDHISGLSPAQISLGETTLPVFRLSAKNPAYLADARRLLECANLAACHRLWTEKL